MSTTVRFWGVRGSVASPGPESVKVGGNTICVEVMAAGPRVILDAGTGLRRLGDSLLPHGPVDATLLLSHMGWDHIQGLPFFAPLYQPTTRLHVVSGPSGMPCRDWSHSIGLIRVEPVDKQGTVDKDFLLQWMDSRLF